MSKPKMFPSLLVVGALALGAAGVPACDSGVSSAFPDLRGKWVVTGDLTPEQLRCARYSFWDSTLNVTQRNSTLSGRFSDGRHVYQTRSCGVGYGTGAVLALGSGSLGAGTLSPGGVLSFSWFFDDGKTWSFEGTATETTMTGTFTNEYGTGTWSAVRP